jgi:hypothetical protein
MCRLPHNKQANENKHPRCKPANYAHLDLVFRKVFDIILLIECQLPTRNLHLAFLL